MLFHSFMVSPCLWLASFPCTICASSSDSYLVQLWVARVIFLMLSHLNMQASAVTPGITEAMNFQSSKVYIMQVVLCLSIGHGRLSYHCTWKLPKLVSLGPTRPSCASTSWSLSSYMSDCLLVDADFCLFEEEFR